MSRVQLALNVDDLEHAVEFYSTLFGVEPAKRKPGYANFAVAEPPLKLVLIENPGQGGSVNHLGVEVESSEKVHAEIARLSEAGVFTEEQIATTCCFATQDKVWVTGPNSERWEVYTVLADTEHFGTEPRFVGKDDAEAVQACCGTDGRGDTTAEEAEAGPTVACCAPAAAR
ncbi:VOC family protein [Nocardia puris]|uniref:ArsI/CadI family heavy metal resistance metalloenzyme n=1 Tax=Nocardia puris TaxID=208602 RepID=UPI0018933B85|nr:ArsI/CadI family heavy metal resistance metalloenzyme [Nocardia puris]MBF6216074.1 VOC family protein [Nocardia puris]